MPALSADKGQAWLLLLWDPKAESVYTSLSAVTTQLPRRCSLSTVRIIYLGLGSLCPYGRGIRLPGHSTARLIISKVPENSSRVSQGKGRGMSQRFTLKLIYWHASPTDKPNVSAHKCSLPRVLPVFTIPAGASELLQCIVGTGPCVPRAELCPTICQRCLCWHIC